MGLVERVTHTVEALRASLARIVTACRTRLARVLAPVWAPLRRLAQRFGGLFLHPRTQQVLYVVSGVAVLASFAAYTSVWLGFNQPMLLNPDLQSDDARTILIPFHRYDSDPAL